MKFSVNHFLSSISFALDYVEMDIIQNISHHNQRVAYIADSMAKEYGLSEIERMDLSVSALLHDSGMAQDRTNIKNLQGLESTITHCRASEDILSVFPMQVKRENILLYHHEFLDGSGYFGIKEVPIFSQIISMADIIERYYNLGHSSNEIYELIKKLKNKFNESLINVFFKISKHPAFWINMEPLFIQKVLNDTLPDHIIDTNWSEIRKITKVLSSIIDTKSVFTARHSQGLANKAEIMADFYKFDEDTKNKFIIAADLHDLGKLAVPNHILDKPGKLTEDEFSIIQKHTYYTRRALESIEGFEDITEWASNHHEKLNGRGYPFGKTDICFKSRVMCVLDIYQALTEDRPYREGLSHEQSMSIIFNMANDGQIDSNIVNDVNSVFMY